MQDAHHKNGFRRKHNSAEARILLTSIKDFKPRVQPCFMQRIDNFG